VRSSLRATEAAKLEGPVLAFEVLAAELVRSVRLWSVVLAEGLVLPVEGRWQKRDDPSGSAVVEHQEEHLAAGLRGWMLPLEPHLQPGHQLLPCSVAACQQDSHHDQVLVSRLAVAHRAVPASTARSLQDAELEKEIAVLLAVQLDPDPKVEMFVALLRHLDIQSAQDD
jgi:hypothetical protein